MLNLAQWIKSLSFRYVLNLVEIGLGLASFHIREIVSYPDFSLFLPYLFLGLAHRRHWALDTLILYIKGRVPPVFVNGVIPKTRLRAT